MPSIVRDCTYPGAGTEGATGGVFLEAARALAYKVTAADLEAVAELSDPQSCQLHRATMIPIGEQPLELL